MGHWNRWLNILVAGLLCILTMRIGGKWNNGSFKQVLPITCLIGSTAQHPHQEQRLTVRIDE